MNIFHGVQNVYHHIHLFYGFLTLVFVCVLSYMFLYGRRSKDKQTQIEHGTPLASKEMGILEAQDAIRHDRREHHRH
jgi:hypothetical protein